MSSTATALRARPTTGDDAALARRAAAGDGAAFATLYDRYEHRAYNLCYRITGSAEDAADATQETFVAVLERLPRLEGRDLNFGAYVMAAARNASYDALARRKRTTPAGDIPESAVPVGAGEGHDRPERHVLRAAHQEQVRLANASLPPRQREVLALREIGELSYDDVAGIMGMNRNSVAQLISRARISLRDSLRHTALGSVAATSPQCDRALPLLALRQDAALDDESAPWLAEHLAGCGACRVRADAIEEAGVAYRQWLPLVPAATAHAAARTSTRHLRLVAAGGAALVIAFVLALADHADTPTRAFPAAAVPDEVAPPARAAAQPVERRRSKRRAVPKPRAPIATARRPEPEADAVRLAAAEPPQTTTTHSVPEPVRPRAAPEPRRKAAPAAEPVAATDPPPDSPAPAPDPVVEEPPPPPPDDPVRTPPCATATTSAACPPPPRPPVLMCERCQVVAPRATPAPRSTVVP